MAYMLEEDLICILFIVLLGTLLFSAASVVMIARAIVRAGLDTVVSWVDARRQETAALFYRQPVQPLTGRQQELITGHGKKYETQSGGHTNESGTSRRGRCVVSYRTC
jgi:hypothetical protein